MLFVITGCMMSGKTTYILDLVRKRLHSRQRILMLRPKMDNRTSEVETHDGIKIPYGMYPSDISVIETDSIVYMNIECDVLIVDEFQFFKKEDAEFLVKFASEKDKEVYVSGLAIDSKGEDFGYMPYIMARADKIHILTSYCGTCGQIATRTQRKEGNSDSQVLIGGKDIYQPACMKCWTPR